MISCKQIISCTHETKSSLHESGIADYSFKDEDGGTDGEDGDPVVVEGEEEDVPRQEDDKRR